MKDINELLSDLDELTGVGGAITETAREAIERIRYQSDELKNAVHVADTLVRHRTILRAALIKIVGAEHPGELNIMKNALLPISLSEDVRAAVTGIQALLDTI